MLEENQGADASVTESTENPSTEGTETPPSDPLAYEKGVSLSEKIAKNPEALQNILELDKLEKFKWQGKEYTPAELKKMAMLQADYTKKTQAIAEEKKALAEEAKYTKNLQYDLDRVRQNPALAAEFKKIYPEAYHPLVDFFQPPETMKKEEPSTIQQEPKAFQDPRVDELYQSVQEMRLEKATIEVNATFDKLVSKYPEASEKEVIGQVQHLLALHKQAPQEYKKPDEKVIEELFRQSQDERVQYAKSYQAKLLKTQREANAKGSGPGAGGSPPGTAPRVARTIKEATELMMGDPNFAG